ncbi:MAG: hypothetical protein HGGPFJEG_00807 [Ignavibacteria bacterium]|nr:hypothetical protein [Ignavibacteria bacterium]
MINKLIFICGFLIFIVPFELKSQVYSDNEWEILQLMDSRILGQDGKINEYLHSIDPKIRQKAIYALANIGDSSTVSLINFLFAGPFKDYPDKNDLMASAFLLGQINCNESRKLLETVFNNPDSFKSEMKESGVYFIDAAGKIGDENLFNIFLNLAENTDSYDQNINSAIAMSLAKFALRKFVNEKSVSVLKQIVKYSQDTSALRNAAYAFWRIGDKSLLLNAKQEIYDLTGSNDPQTRMWAFNALGKFKDNLLLMYTLESFIAEKDWRVKVNMLNSLGNYNLDSIPELTLHIFSLLGDAFNDDNEHVSLTSIAVMGNIFQNIRKSKNSVANSMASGIKEELLAALNEPKKFSVLQRSEITKTLAKMYRDEVKKDLLSALVLSNDYFFKSNVIKSFGFFDDYNIFKEVRDSVSSEVRKYNLSYQINSGEMIGSTDLALLYRGFVQMLSDLDDKAKADDLNSIRLIFTEFASSKDPVITDVCLTALQDSLYKDFKDETSQVILFDFDDLNYPQDETVILIFIDAMKKLYNDSTYKSLEKYLNFGNYEIAKAAKETLENITWKKYGQNVFPETDHDLEYMKNLDSKKFVVLKTSKGQINVELFPDIAPFTVQNFLKLAEKDYYDNTVFHRVVPNFVIQGGDPSGTGYGGPGYSIRSEFSPVKFETGFLGMASSGKDTEGSQFFITHSATPHLDGKYTLFGKVVNTIDVVDKIQQGDTLKDVTIIKQ